jgi:site-specific DNA-methyltransferase (adenine-specific)
MTPYYDEGGITIYLGDCREMSLPMGDVVITDPPYGDTSLDWDRWQTGWLDAIGAVAPTLWCFGSFRMFFDHASEFVAWTLAQDVVWEKHNGSGFMADRFRRVHEHAVQFYRGAWADIYKSPVFTQDATRRTVRRKERPPHTGEIDDSTYTSQDGGPKLMRSVLHVRSEHGQAQHPTQKPLGVLRPLIDYSCPPGGRIIDPFMGSGSTLRAAKDMGRLAVGVEVSERYCEIAALRMGQEVLSL